MSGGDLGLGILFTLITSHVRGYHVYFHALYIIGQAPGCQ